MSRTEEGLRQKQLKKLWAQQEDVADVCIKHITDLQYSVDMEGALYAHCELQSAINVLLKLVLKEAKLHDANYDPYEEDDVTDTVIHCKDCKHRPEVKKNERGCDYLEFPDEGICPFECDDPWYNSMPEDDFYCKNAERREDNDIE